MLPVIPLLILLLFQGVSPQQGGVKASYAPESLQVCIRAQEQWLIEAIQEHLSAQIKPNFSVETSLETSQVSLEFASPSGKLSQGFFVSARNRDGPTA